MKRKKIIVAALFLSYVVSYMAFRSYHVETWYKDGQQYLIFPKSKIWVYYFYRPITYIDSKLTSMQFHIGPHQ